MHACTHSPTHSPCISSYHPVRQPAPPSLYRAWPRSALEPTLPWPKTLGQSHGPWSWTHRTETCRYGHDALFAPAGIRIMLVAKPRKSLSTTACTAVLVRGPEAGCCLLYRPAYDHVHIVLERVDHGVRAGFMLVLKQGWYCCWQCCGVASVANAPIDHGLVCMHVAHVDILYIMHVPAAGSCPTPTNPLS